MARPPSRSKPPDMQGLTQLPPSPRMGMLRPLTPSSSSGLAVTGEGRDSVGEVKREVRAAAAKLAELAGAVETDGRMKDSSSLLRRPFTPGGSALPPRPGTGKASMLGTASDIDALIGTASEAKNPKAALTELLFQVVEDTERCVLTLTEKRAPRPAHLPEPSASAGRVGSRMQVHDALIDRALALHGALQSSSSHASGSSSPVVPASVPDATKAVENPKELAALREELRAAKEECERLRNRPSPAAAPPPAPPAAAPPAPAAAPAPAGDSKRVEELVAQKRELEEQKRALTLDRTHLTEEQGRFKEEVRPGLPRDDNLCIKSMRLSIMSALLKVFLSGFPDTVTDLWVC
ncbi:hypothetical protein T484DRAFT_2242806 [Baffinella frigidus]|nr:hypothetical protein T484DRAFT_2242806 [Cryptophyta sp. CCMP2293]